MEVGGGREGGGEEERYLLDARKRGCPNVEVRHLWKRMRKMEGTNKSPIDT